MRLFVFLLLSVLSLRGDVTLAPLFAEHAVLQRDAPLPVWGFAEAGEHVTVSFAGQTVSTRADKTGQWIVYLAALPANAQPAELTVAGKNTVRVSDILVGDVWLCSGQSNMEWRVMHSQNAPAEIAGASHPLIRQIKIERAVSDSAKTDAKGTWLVCSPSTVGEFTAIGYFFARDLQPRLGVPIGIINSTWSGTPIEAWMSPAALASDPAFGVVAERWQKALAKYPANKAEYDVEFAKWTADKAAAAASKEPFSARPPRVPHGPGHSHTPTGLFNGMINPLTPYALRGVLWYQGESNAPRAAEYAKLFRALIFHWRQHFGQPELPFLWVQLANYKEPHDETGVSWAFLREAQAEALALPATGQAVAIDIGDADDIHPSNKPEAARRLALIARAKVYGMATDHSGPVFGSATREGSSMRVRFKNAGWGLTAVEKPLASFELAGADRKFFPAVARIEQDSVVVTSAEVTEPVAVRYAWSNNPEANLFNGAGLPAAPFRSDNW